MGAIILVVTLLASLELLEAVEEASAFTHYNLTNLKPGDVIRAWGDGVSTGRVLPSSA